MKVVRGMEVARSTPISRRKDISDPRRDNSPEIQCYFIVEGKVESKVCRGECEFVIALLPESSICRHCCKHTASVSTSIADSPEPQLSPVTYQSMGPD